MGDERGPREANGESRDRAKGGLREGKTDRAQASRLEKEAKHALRFLAGRSGREEEYGQRRQGSGGICDERESRD
jgi:hypothetical protein